MTGKMGVYRPADPPVLVVRATRDSVSDGRYVAVGNGVQRASASAQFSRQVFGQVMNLVHAEGPDAALLRSSPKVVILWWGISLGCTVWFPHVNRDPSLGELFVLSRPRPKSEWINGLPTFDVHYADWVYNQRMENSRAPDSAMTVTEYRKFFNALPIDNSGADFLDNWKGILDWANSNPHLARKQPAAPIICAARTAFDRSISCTNP